MPKIEVDLNDTTYQAALNRAQSEGKTLEAVIVELVSDYSAGQAAGIRSYTVQRGDSLSRIAREMYGDPHQYVLIQQANNLSDPGRIWVGQVLIIPPIKTVSPAPAPTTPTPSPAPISPAEPVPAPTLPSTPEPVPAPTPPPIPEPVPVPEPPKPPEPTRPTVDPCAPIPNESYTTLPIVGSPTDRPADKHGDINLALRGYSKTEAQLGLIDMSGPTDHRAPQLAGLFKDHRTGVFTTTYRVNNWDWGSNSRGSVITDFETTLGGLKVEPGEIIRVPGAGYDIGQGNQVLVLYASRERITLKYTGEDTVATGYAIHVEGICTEPSLLALYERMNSEGRRHLPALKAGQAFGRARGEEIQVAIRDTGRFMDPRVRKDWWH
ncbi:MAG: LysM peptidoglycan-binding domain-containing protein [Anaerolineales bacterium]|nr:LysM peptidoglycan-binding domain-containing protein [Anaerolineales bacterium]